MFIVSSKGTTKSTDVLAKENKTNHLLSFTNTGELVDGMINTNISNSNEIRSIFERMKKLNVTTQCNIMDYTLFVVKFCQKNQKEQENQQQEQEPPKGTYSSSIKVSKMITCQSLSIKCSEGHPPSAELISQTLHFTLTSL